MRRRPHFLNFTRLCPAYVMRHGPFLARLVFSNEKAYTHTNTYTHPHPLDFTCPQTSTHNYTRPHTNTPPPFYMCQYCYCRLIVGLIVVKYNNFYSFLSCKLNYLIPSNFISPLNVKYQKEDLNVRYNLGDLNSHVCKGMRTCVSPVE